MKTPIQPLPPLVLACQYLGGFESFSYIDQWLILHGAEVQVHDRTDHLTIDTEACLYRANPNDYVVIIGTHVAVYTQDFYNEHYRKA